VRSGLDQGAVDKTRQTYGALDLLFNNAGIGARCRRRNPLDKWQAVVATNFTGVFLCTQEAIKIMKAQTPRGGRIINNGLDLAHTAAAGAAAYTATKHAVTGLTNRPRSTAAAPTSVAARSTSAMRPRRLTDRMVQGRVAEPAAAKVESPHGRDDVGRAVV